MGKIGKYLGVTFVVSWLLWGSVVVFSRLGIKFMMFGSSIGTLFYVLGGVSPAICEIVLKKKSSSKEEFKSFLKSIVNPRHSIWMYVFAIGGAMAIQAIPVLFHLSEVKQPLYMGFAMIIPMIIGGGVEEIGWRGLLQPQLEEKYPPIVSKIRYELSVYITNDPKKMEKILPKLKPQQTGARFMELVAQLIQKGIEQNIFCSELALDVIMTNISIYIDGMSEYVVRMRVYNGPKLNDPVSTYFEQFIRSQISQWKKRCES